MLVDIDFVPTQQTDLDMLFFLWHKAHRSQCGTDGTALQMANTVRVDC